MLFAPVVLNAFTTRAAEAMAAIRSAADSPFGPRSSDMPFAPWPIGLVASTSTCPAVRASSRTALGTTPQGTARITTSADRAASPTETSRVAEGTPPLTPLAGSRVPNVTECPASLNRRPSVPPTLPAPMTAMFMDRPPPPPAPVSSATPATYYFTMESIVDPDAPGAFEARYLAFLGTVTHLRASLHRYCSRMTGSVFDGEDV